MTVPRVEVLGEDDLGPVVTAVAAWQARPEHHVVYVGVQPDELAEELAEADDWQARTFVARSPEGEVVGVVQADVDVDRGRVWWIGPWGRDDVLRAAVLEHAAAALPDGVVDEEFAPDQRNTAVGRLAAARGATARTPSSVLRLDPLVVPASAPVADVAVVPLDPADHAGALAPLHDELFPGTHTTGAALLERPDGTVLVAVAPPGGVAAPALVAGGVLGYVAVETHADGSLYVDYLGTAPVARRRGVARALLLAALDRAAASGHTRSHLTVRHDADGARELYRSLGYVEERVIQPWRRGGGPA